MGIKIKLTPGLDIDNPPVELINWCSKQHRKGIKRLKNLDDYYLGEHKINKRSRKNEKCSNSKVMINQAKITTDTVVGFVVGNPIAYSSTDGKNIEPILEALKYMDASSHDTELKKDLSVFGEGYEILYLSENEDEAQIKIGVLDPRSCYVATDSTLEQNPLFAVHYTKDECWQKGSTEYTFNVYTQTHVHTYRTQNDTHLNESDWVESTEHYFGMLPVIEYKNNKERQGDYEQAISLIDAYNQLQSDRLSDKENFVEAILILYGFRLAQNGEEVTGLDGDPNARANDSQMLIEAPSKSDGAEAQWLTKAFDENAVQVLADSLISDLHKVTYVPDLSDASFGGTQTGVAMKYKLLGLLNLLATKQRYLSQGLRKRLKLIENMQNIRFHGSQASDTSTVTILVKPNLPVNLLEIIQQIRDSQEFLPLTTTLKWIPEIDNPQEVIDELRKQRKEDLVLNREATNEYIESEVEDDD